MLYGQCNWLFDNMLLRMSTQTRRDLKWMEPMRFWSMLIMLIYGRKTFEPRKKYLIFIRQIPLCYDTIIYKTRNVQTTFIFRQQILYAWKCDLVRVKRGLSPAHNSSKTTHMEEESVKKYSDCKWWQKVEY